jgi:hypothetical protein
MILIIYSITIEFSLAHQRNINAKHCQLTTNITTTTTAHAGRGPRDERMRTRDEMGIQSKSIEFLFVFYLLMTTFSQQ